MEQEILKQKFNWGFSRIKNIYNNDKFVSLLPTGQLNQIFGKVTQLTSDVPSWEHPTILEGIEQFLMFNTGKEEYSTTLWTGEAYNNGYSALPLISTPYFEINETANSLISQKNIEDNSIYYLQNNRLMHVKIIQKITNSTNPSVIAAETNNPTLIEESSGREIKVTINHSSYGKNNNLYNFCLAMSTSVTIDEQSFLAVPHDSSQYASRNTHYCNRLPISHSLIAFTEGEGCYISCDFPVDNDETYRIYIRLLKERFEGIDDTTIIKEFKRMVVNSAFPSLEFVLYMKYPVRFINSNVSLPDEIQFNPNVVSTLTGSNNLLGINTTFRTNTII